MGTLYCIFLQVEDTDDKIHPQDRQTVKQLIVGLMLKSPEQIQKQVTTIDVFNILYHIMSLLGVK